MNLKQLPISEFQKRFFWEWVLAPLEVAYNISYVNKIEGKLDERILKRACEAFINRNDIIYSQFSENGEVCYYGDFSINDFYYESIFDSNRSKQSQIQDFLYKPFDLTKGPLFRIYLIKNKEEDNEEYYFFFVAHHIICDAVGISKFFIQIEEAYNNFINGKDISIISKKTFSQAIEAERKLINKNYEAKAQEFWLDFIGDMPLSVSLPYTSGIGAFDLDNHFSDKAGEFIYFKLSELHSTQLRAYAEQKGTTLFVVLSALFGFILSKYINQEPFFFSYPVNTRPDGFKDVEGCFVNNIPMKIELNGVSTVAELIDLLTAQRKVVKDYQGYSLVNIIDDQRKYNRNKVISIFNIGFLQSYLNVVPFKLEDLKCLPVDISNRKNSIYEIGLLYDDRSTQIKFKFEYRKALFDQNLIKGFIGSFRKIIKDLVDGAEIFIKDYSVLRPEAYDRIVYEWNSTDREYEQDKTRY